MMHYADTYLASNLLQKKDSRALLEEFLPRLQWQPGQETVLDVGCGPGDITRHILQPLLPPDCNLTGVDISPAMIEHATGEHQNPGLCFKVADFGSQHMASILGAEHFSKVFSFFCLHWIHDQRQAIRNLHDLLWPGGDVVMIAITKITGMTVFKILAATDLWSPYMKDVEQYFPLYNLNGEENVEGMMTSLIVSERLNPLVCEERDLTHVYPSLAVLIDSWIAVGPWMKRIPEDLRQRFREHMTRLTLEHSLCDILQDSSARISYKVLVMHCRKPASTLGVV